MKSGVLRRMPIHRKLMAIIMISSGSALLLTAVMSMVYAYLQVRQDVAVNLEASAALALANSRAAISFEDPVDARETLETLGANPSIRLACLYRASGVLFADFRPDAEGPSCPAAPPPVGHRYSAGRLEIVQRDSFDGRLTEWLLIHGDLGLLTDRLRSQATITLFVLFVALVVAFVVSASLQRIVSRPVVDLANLTHAVSMTGDYSRRATVRSEDELGILATSVNNMLDRITRAEADREIALTREREANRTKDEFLATLSHELRTPLSAVLGWTQLLRRKLVPEKDIDQTLDRIERNAHAQDRLIGDLLDVSRILSGKLSLQQHTVDLASVTRSVVDSLVPLAQSRGVALRMHVDANRHLAAVDPQRMSQVIGNLLSNSLKFTPQGGRIEVTLRAAGSMQELSVTDTGAGITADFLPRVFEPFRQADSSHTRKHGGLGLGLAIAKRIVEMHGGDITAESNGVGAGSQFVVRLPTAADVAVLPPVVDDAQTDRAMPDLSAYTVLVVDDDPDTRDLVAATLRPTQARVLVASSADEGLETASATPPDVLITDIAMPDLDGYTMVRQMRQALGLRMPRLVVALSAFAAQADSERSLAQGFDAHLTKPFDPKFLLALMRDRLSTNGASLASASDGNS